MQMQESAQMYLETIYVLSQEGRPVRSVDIAAHMGYSKPSVSRAVSRLKRSGHIVVDDNGFLSLTEAGLAEAGKIFERHKVISRILVMLGVDKEVAAEDACRIEHVISDESFDAMKKHLGGVL